MADVIVVESAPSPPSPISPPSAPSPDVVEIVHDDAMSLGFALAQIAQHETAIQEIRGQIQVLIAVNDAQLDAVTAVTAAVGEVADAVEEIEHGNDVADEIQANPEPVAPDTPPGKTHWLKRPAKEWIAR